MNWDDIILPTDFGTERDEYAAQPNIFAAKDIDPDKRARSLSLQKDNRLPVEVLETNLPAYEAESRFKKFDLQQYSDTPVTMAGFTHPQEAPLYMDDAENLSAWERFFKGISNSWRAGQRQVALREINRKRFNGIATDEDYRLKKILEAQDMRYKSGGGFDNFFAQIPAQIAEMAPLYLNALAESYDEAAVGGAAGLTALGPVGGGTGLALGVGYGTIIEMGKTEAYLAYNDLSELRDVTGKKIDDNAAKGAAAVVGIINGAVELGGANILGKATGLDKLASRFSRHGLKALMKIPSAQKVFARIGIALAGGSAEQGAEEAIQEGVSLIVGENIAAALNKSAAGVVLTPMEQVKEQIGQSAKAGAQVGIAFTGPHAASIALADSMRMRALNRNLDLTHELAGLVDNSKTLQRMPQKWRDHIAAIKDEYGVTENVTVPYDILQTFFQESGVTSQVLQNEAPAVAKAVEEASQTRSDVAIPVEEYATFFARSEAFAPYVQDVRMHPELPTDREAAEIQQTVKEMAATIKPKDQGVYESFRAKLEQAESPEVAEFQARLLASFFEVQAAEMGVSTQELYDQYKIDIERQDIGGLQTEELISMIQSENVPSDSEIYGPSLQEFVKNYGNNETVFEEAVKRGYFDTEDPAQVTRADFDQAMQESKPRYAYGAENTQAQMTRQKVDALREEAKALGVDVSKGTPQEVAKALRGNSFEQNQQEPRGFISMNRARDYFKITLTGKSNLSTMLHESGHMFLELMQDLSSRVDTSERIVKDMQIIRDWLGVKPGEEFTRENHETFARGFEAYLMEGKAPSEDLQSAFKRFRTWLKSIYHEILALGVDLSPEIRGVFDRMIASEEAINRTAEIDRLMPTFTDAEQAGMTLEEWADYAGSWAQGMEEAEEEMLRRLMYEMTAHNRKQNRKITQDIRDDVEKDVHSRPVYQAIHFLRHGTLPDGSHPSAALGKLDRSIVERLRPDLSISKDLRGMTVDEGGVHPTIVARYFGFKDADQMLTVIVEAPPMKETIKAETQERFKAVFGDSMEQVSELPKMARKALHNDRIADMLTRELRLFGKKTGRPLPKGFTDAARQYAEQQIDNTAVGDLAPFKFQMAEQRYGKQAFEAAAKNDWLAAAEAKRLQIINHWLARKAIAAKDEADSIRNYLSRFETPNKRKKLGLAGGTYLESIDILLDGIQLTKISGVQIDRRRSLESYLQRMEADGQIVQIPDYLRSEIGLKNWREMKVEEFRALRDAVKNIDHLSQLKNKLMLGKEKRDFDAAMLSIVDRIITNGKPIKSSQKQNPSGWEKFRAKMRGFDADMFKIEFLLEQMDGIGAGLIHELIFQGMAEAQVKKYDMLKDINKRLYDPMRKMPKEQKARLAAEYNFLGTTMHGHEVMAVALNTGNTGNLQKLIKGYQERGWTEDTIQQELDRILTAEDWAMVQHIWNEIGSFWPEIAALNKKYTGLEPPKVEPREIKSAHGTFAGGYYPVIYDPRRSHRAFQNAQKGSDLFENNFMRPNVSSGFTEARTAYSAPILLSLDGIPNHLNEVIHYLTHYEAVTQANKIINDERFRFHVTEYVGEEYYRQLKPWLQAIAADGKADDTATWMEGFARHLTMGTSIMAMGFSTSTSLIQLLGLSSSLSRLGAKWLVTGLKGLVNPGQRKYALEHSTELRHTMETFDRDARSSYNQMLAMVAGDTIQKAKYRHAQVVNFAFWTMGLLQQQVNVATWIAAYNQACAEGHASPEAAADVAVRLTQSGGGIKDMAKIQRHAGLRKMFTSFYTYFSVLYGQLRQAGRRLPKDTMTGSAQLAALILLPVLVEKLLRDGLPDEDEPVDKWIKGYMSGLASYGLATLPIARDIIQPLFTDYGYSMSPGASIIDKGLQSFEKAAKGDADLTASQIKNLARLVGLAGHLPATQAIRTWEYFDALYDGEVEEPVRELIFGVKKK